MTGDALASGSDSPWLHRVRPGPGAHRVIFFPPAGSSASLTWKLAGRVPDRWGLWGVQYPARGPRLREPPACSIREIAVACLPAIRPAADVTVLFGHSFGALVAYDMAQLLADTGSPAAGLVVAGMVSPGTVVPGFLTGDVSDATALDALRKQGGTACELLSNEELMELVLPALRGDLTLARAYRDDHGRRLRTGVVAISGRDEPVLAADDLCSWQTMTEAWWGHVVGEGGHFCYLEDSDLVADVLNRHWP